MIRNNCPAFAGVLCIALAGPLSAKPRWTAFDGSVTTLESDATTMKGKLPGPSVTIVGEDAQGVKTEVVRDIRRYAITMQVTGFVRDEVSIDEEDFTMISMPETSPQSFETGKPAVPVKRLILPIPSGMKPAVNVRRSEETTIGNISLEPAQPPVHEMRKRGPFVKDAPTYRSDQFFPAGNIMHTEVFKMRNRRFLIVDIAPVRVRPASRNLTAARLLNLEVTFSQDDSKESLVEEDLSDPLEK
jgi:hypothetical protein